MNETVKPRILLGLFSAALALVACSAPVEPPLKGATIGGAFTLVDQDGRQATDKRFEGQYRIFYFGFTHCPDICPTDMVSIGQGLKRFEQKDAARAARVQPIFITVDPVRDTPAVLKQYVAAFHPRLIGLTGTPQQVAAAAKAFTIYYRKEPAAGGGYTMNHSRFALLFGPKGEPIAILPQDKGADAVAAELDRWVS